MRIAAFYISVILTIMMGDSFGQVSDSLPLDEQLSAKYLKDLQQKITQYRSRVTDKTLKTLEKLSVWENKIKRLLGKVDPAAASKLFNDEAITFSTLLKKIKAGETIAVHCQAQYNKYMDDAITNLEYLSWYKEFAGSAINTKINSVGTVIRNLSTEEKSMEAVQQIIKERKKLLVEQAIQHLGHNRYFKKINKEVYYYAESVKNYKKILTEPGKAEEMVKGILNKIPAFKKFAQKNSMLSAMFNSSEAGEEPGANPGQPGLQTRASVQDIMQGSLATGGMGARQRVQQNIQAAQVQVSQLAEKLHVKGAASQGGDDMPGFTVNQQRSKTFLQRLEVATNIQSSKANNCFPITTGLGLSIGYKMNDKSIAGFGIAYKMGWGSGFDHIAISHEGIGLRCFIDYKLKGNLALSGGYEQNYQSKFSTFRELASFSSWYSSALLGLVKQLKLGKSKAKVQFSYDLFSKRHLPATQSFIYRIIYNLK